MLLEKSMENENTYYATGKRKSSVARTWLVPGSGQISINGQVAEEYLTTESSKLIIRQPLEMTDTQDAYDIKVKVHGGGVSGQAGAIRHGITKALIIANPDFRQKLKKAGFIKRDPRVKERKKYGQKGARARFQFSKR
jgi:small subunit ribosomal protein S9